MSLKEELDAAYVKYHYLGDGAFIGITKTGTFCIFTSNGESVTNAVYLEHSEMITLQNFVEKTAGS